MGEVEDRTRAGEGARVGARVGRMERELPLEAEGALQTGTAIMHCADWHTKRTRIELACNSQVPPSASLPLVSCCLVLLMDNLNA